MASVFKRGRWVDANGRKCTKDTPGAKWTESRFYTVQVNLAGRIRRIKGYTDRAASEQMGPSLSVKRPRAQRGWKIRTRRTAIDGLPSMSRTGFRNFGNWAAMMCMWACVNAAWPG
jgi:hypothetical protein